MNIFIRTLWLCLFFSVCGIAQDNEYKIELLTEEDGFVSSEIYSILQDKQGFLWFGTAEHGLMRYDGKNIKLFENIIDNPTSLSHNNAGNIMIDTSGKIWVGTWGGGTNQFNLETNKFTHFINSNQANSISSNRIQSLFQDSEGSMWFGTYADGLNKLMPDTLGFEHFQHDASTPTSLSNNRIWDIENASASSLWIATSHGLNLFDKNTQKFTNSIPEPSDASASDRNIIRNILVSKSGLLYLGTQGGIVTFDTRSKEFKAINSLAGRPIGKIYSLIQDKQGNVWAGSTSGLYKMNPKDNTAVKFTLPQEGPIRIIFQDNAGTFWATSELHGIYKIVPQKTFYSIGSDFLKSPNELMVDLNGDIIIATAEASILKWDRTLNKISVMHSNLFESLNDTDPALRQTYKASLHQENKNVIWFAQQTKLLRYDISKNEVTEIKYPENHENSSVFEELKDISSDTYGRIWIGTYKSGLHIYDPKTSSFEHFMPNRNDPHSLSHAEVLTVYRDRQGRMWVGTGHGLNLWDDKIKGFRRFQNVIGDETSLAGSIVSTIHQDRGGKLWVGTKLGLNSLDTEIGTFKHFNTQNGFASNLIRAISDDGKGNLWVTTNKGITKFNPQTGAVDNYDHNDGLLSIKYYPNALIQAGQDTILLSGPRGIDYFHPSKIDTNIITANTNNAKVILSGFQKMGKPALLDTPYEYVKEIKLDYVEDFFAFEFISPDFRSPEKTQYAYKLTGFDREWIEVGNQNTATYTNLDGGDYTFLAKASSRSGIWGDDVLTIKVSVAPVPWKTWWAYSFYLLFTLLCIIVYIRYKTRVQKAEIQLQKHFVTSLEKQVKEKTTTLTDKTKKLEEVNVELKKLTYKDGLLGLYNRRYFDQTLLSEIQRHQRRKHPLSLILCDIDDFKLYNDHYGHVEGDACLIEVAKVISDSALRTSDSACRYGGEEFGIILSDTDSKNASVIAKAIKQKIKKTNIPHAKSKTADHITLSFGVVTIVPNRETTPEDIINLADAALYESKNAGRNTVTTSL